MPKKKVNSAICEVAIATAVEARNIRQLVIFLILIGNIRMMIMTFLWLMLTGFVNFLELIRSWNYFTSTSTVIS